MTYSPTTRLLTVLELLQSTMASSVPIWRQNSKSISGVCAAMSARFVTLVFRSAAALDGPDLQAVNPGYRLPPLMFTNSEVMAILLGL